MVGICATCIPPLSTLEEAERMAGMIGEDQARGRVLCAVERQCCAEGECAPFDAQARGVVQRVLRIRERQDA